MHEGIIERSPPENFIEVKVVLGDNRIGLKWVPETGQLTVGKGSKDSAITFSKNFKRMKAESISSFLRRLDDVLSGVLDPDAISAMKGMVSKMASLLPKKKARDEERESEDEGGT